MNLPNALALLSGEPIYTLSEVSALYDRARARGFEEADDAWAERLAGFEHEVDELRRALATFAVEAAKNTRRLLAEVESLEGRNAILRAERDALLDEAREEGDDRARLVAAIHAHRDGVSRTLATTADRRLWAEVGR